MQRFFVDFDAVSDNRITVTGDDARHISFSLRMKKGDAISVCTPDMKQYSCVITDFSRDSVTAEIVGAEDCGAEPPYRVHLYQALPKGDKTDTIIQKAVECGVYSVTLFESSRCIAKASGAIEKKLVRWNRISSEAAKQCGRGMIPEVNGVLDFDGMLAEASRCGLPLFCYENEDGNLLGNVIRGSDSNEISVVIGAEGGFSSEEAEKAITAGLIPVGLGKRILRCETASSFVLACISLCRELM